MNSLNQFLKQGAFALLGLGLVTAPAHAVNITTTSNANVLVNSILGSGITVSNVKYNGASVASGTFTNGLSPVIGIDTGIILTSGNANLAPGPNTQDGATGNNGLPGDANLNSLIPGFNTFDASTLQFDFTSATGDLFFNYVFASEEYNEFVNSNFNDVFGFFLDGVNIALLPGTTTPVSINNVNGGNPLGTNAKNSQFFNNNDPSDGGPFFNLQYDGFTKVFTASAKGLSAGKHTIKLAIADAGDSSFDSAVFIQGGTFSGEPPKSVPEPTTMLGILGLGIFGATSSLKRKQQNKTVAKG
ncbi:choice-of-anchor L family PEP-CTERM protein [Nostoc favosum]|uniref:PEP-CTERM sorting domain-containing protein n=1 Tax=Nostoc favosum CHAB5714 TaxID=2780399 RepID=A0ABS8I451_9NOSO|nr:choice-of-anchor L domain-containing protein [Nostoc favosum]MCC5598594.1 PEP-CTERM sorting domain-containing protein [Nostoc favosum CHAB5714]